MSSVNPPPPSLFQGYGVELEYMIVHEDSLDVFPVADRLLYAVSGSHDGEVERGALGWSNELVQHVVELKTLGPVPALDRLAPWFQEDVVAINRLLAEWGGLLMPTAMHPWMDPHRETRLWPHGSHEIYEAYNRIFDCRGHGWANLQSTHLNLAFCGDAEFSRLHTAIRLILPLIPALAASSPVVAGKPGGSLDSRLEFYRHNQRRIPSISGTVVPEAVFSEEEYRGKILGRIFRDIAPHDPDNILQHEWLNSRGAIARFERSAIEIRLIDIQECPAADLAVASAIAAAVQALVGGKWSSIEIQAALTEDRLAAVLFDTIRDGGAAVIRDRSFLRQFGYAGPSLTAGELWRFLVEETFPETGSTDSELCRTLAVILDRGTLAGRLLQALGDDFSHDKLREIYRELCRCLAGGKLFLV